MKSSIYLVSVDFEGTLLGRKCIGILKIAMPFNLLFYFITIGHILLTISSMPDRGYMCINNLFVVPFTRLWALNTCNNLPREKTRRLEIGCSVYAEELVQFPALRFGDSNH